MQNFTQIVSERLRSEKTNTNPIKVGDVVRAVEGKGAFADCFPPIEVTILKINKKTFKTVCGKTIDLINIR